MRIFDSLSETKKPFPKTGRQIKLFVCGITPYDHTHIGHARTYVAFDIIVRYLRSQGWKINYLQNVTDVDDKILEAAKKQKVGWKELERKFEKEYHANEKALGIESVSRYARATEHIPQIIKQVEILMEKGYAYEIKRGGIYFDVSKFKDYGKLARRTTQQAEDGTSRIDESIKKRNKADFCLWKFSHANSAPKDNSNAPTRMKNESSWKSPWGIGRPGWHIEDTAITEHYLGPQYDIHGGAVDLKFPHHEAEIAQQEAASEKKPLAKIWMHTGFLLVNGQKMSKSLKNFITIDEFLVKYSPPVFRYIIFSHHYRSPIDYSENLAQQAKSALDGLQNFILKLNLVPKRSSAREIITEKIEETGKKFGEAMNDDFNTPQALAALFELVNFIEKQFPLLSSAEAQLVQNFIIKNLASVGFTLEKEAKIPVKILELAKKRDQLRSNKQFIQSDVLRDQIHALGYSIEDTAFGPFIKRVNSEQ